MKLTGTALSRFLAAGLIIGLASATNNVLREAEAASGELAQRPEISLEAGLVQLDVDRVPLAAVLAELADLGGFEVEIRGSVDESVSEIITGLPIDRALGRLLGPGRYSFYLQFAAADASGAASRQLEKVVVIGRDRDFVLESRPSQIQTLPLQSDTFEEDDYVAELDEYLSEEDYALTDEEAIEVLEEILQEEDDPLVREEIEEVIFEILQGE